jgi:hypothetical protein
MRTPPLLVVAFLLATASPCQAGDFWKEKDYLLWSMKECQKMLEDSPWAKAYILSQVITPSPDPPLPNPREAAGREQRQKPHTVFHLQLRSARPVRQALVQLGQLYTPFEVLSDEEVRQFDEQAGRFLAAEFSSEVVVHVAYRSDVEADNQRLRQHWQAQTTERLRDSVFLIGSRGARVPLRHYTVAQGVQQAFQFVFPRQVEGRPVVGPQDEWLQVEFRYNGQRLRVEFPTKKMMVDGELLF